MTVVRRDEDAWRMVGEMQRDIAALQRLIVPEPLIVDGRLPENPYDGQIAKVQAVEGINWTFRYNADSSSSKKWELEHGLPLYAEVTSQESTASATYTDLSTPGPILTVPFQGDYYVELGARIICSTAGSDSYASYAIGSATADDLDGMNSRQSDAASGFNIRNHYMRRRRKDDFAARTVLTSKYKTNAPGGALFGSRWLGLIPIRVS